MDKSAWEQSRYSDAARARLRELPAQQRAAVCVVSTAEMLYSAGGGQDLAAIRRDFEGPPYLFVTEEVERRVPEVMALLATRGQHRRPIPDLLLAAIAEMNGAAVLHYDSDFELIAQATGQPHEWIVPRGTGHGND